MIKKTERHKKYAKLAVQLLLKSQQQANKLFESWLQLLVAQKAVPIVTFKHEKNGINILNHSCGKSKKVAYGLGYWCFLACMSLG